MGEGVGEDRDRIGAAEAGQGRPPRLPDRRRRTTDHQSYPSQPPLVTSDLGAVDMQDLTGDVRKRLQEQDGIDQRR